jgi:arylsulfatase A-like enzyme
MLFQPQSSQLKMKTAILIFSGLLWVHGGQLAAAAPEVKRPNILLIYSDDQSYKTVSCYPESFPWAKTPNIDRLAASGVRFRAGYLGAWCMPSRASMLTGRHPHGVETMRMEGTYPASAYDPKVCRFWPAVFREQGYHTAQIGKWHTGVDAGWARDWDHQIVWNRPLHPENAGAYYERQLLAFNGQEKWVDGYPADNYTQWALDYVRGQNRDVGKPWFLWLCYGSIHGPSKPAARHKGRYAQAEVSTPKDIFPPRPGKPAYLNDTQAWTKDADGTPIAGPSGETFGDESSEKRQTFADFVRQMNECVPAIDEGVGKLLDALRETGQLENTLVIYTADQGFGMGEHGFRTKLGPYDGTYRSPLIVFKSGLTPSGKVCDKPVNAPDLVATFAALAGVKIPWPTHGRDLTPLLRNPAALWPYPCLYEHTGEHYGSDVAKVVNRDPAAAGYHNVPWYVAIVQDGWKLIHYPKPGVGDELYDLRNDPEELTNRIAAPGQKERLAKLRAALTTELERTQSGFGVQTH